MLTTTARHVVVFMSHLFSKCLRELLGLRLQTLLPLRACADNSMLSCALCIWNF